jgi:MoxR-like ATPase
MLVNLGGLHPIENLERQVDGMQIPQLAEQVWQVHVDETLRAYIVALVQATRKHPELALGASPRGSLALFRSAQARAAIRNRTFVEPEDIQTLAPLTLPHRCIVRPESVLRGRTPNAIIGEIMEATPLDLGGVER